MINKCKDVEYCEVDKNKIMTIDPKFNQEALKMLYNFIIERYSIHINKDIKQLEPPYTNDDVLGMYKFTNIRREHDRTSKWLIDNISNNKSIPLYDKIYKTILFRIYNKISTAKALELDKIDFNSDDFVEDAWVYICTSRLKYELDKGTKLFTNAYKTGGTKRGLFTLYPESEDKNYSPLYLIQDLRNKSFASSLLDCNSQDEVFYMLRDIKGFGNFIAYQIFVDLTYIDEFPFSENEYTVCGPGCHYGLQLLLEDFNGLTGEEVIFWMRDNLVDLFNNNGLSFDPMNVFSDLDMNDRKFNVMSLENIMCEFSKYYSLKTKRRKTRMKYRPYEER